MALGTFFDNGTYGTKGTPWAVL